LIASEKNDFFGWRCQAGVNYFTIWNNGGVYACESNLFGTKNSFGNLYDENFDWQVGSGLGCVLKRCVCLGDVQIPKVKNID
jgi:radical SAM protein with 4Fe4S-binding SPASM domain